LVLDLEKKLIKKIESEVKKYFNKENSHAWDHTHRVLNNAIYIAKKERANLDIVIISALLHDIMRWKEKEFKGKLCHAELGAKEAKKILNKYDFSQDFIVAVVHCIKSHRGRNNIAPKTIEAKVLFDADKLDSIGAIGVGRAFMFAGEVGAKFHEKNVDLKKTKPYTIDDTAYREFLMTLKYIKNKMLTQTGKEIAKERDKFMVDFFIRLNKEVAGEL